MFCLHLVVLFFQHSHLVFLSFLFFSFLFLFFSFFFFFFFFFFFNLSLSLSLFSYLFPQNTMSRFQFSGVINWFPGHMHKATSEMNATLHQFDLILEVRDARLPWGTAPSLLRSPTSSYLDKRRVVVFNKVDLVDPSFSSKISQQYASKKHVLPYFCNGTKPQTLKNLIPTALQLLSQTSPTPLEKDLHTGSNVKSRKNMNILVAGLPNVGKSTIINSIFYLSTAGKGKRKVEVGNRPGVTRRVSTGIKVCDDPLTHLVDSPGIMFPSVENTQHGLNLALIDCIKGTRVNPEVLCEFLFETLLELYPTPPPSSPSSLPPLPSYLSFLSLPPSSLPPPMVGHLLQMIADIYFPRSKRGGGGGGGGGRGEGEGRGGKKRRRGMEKMDEEIGGEGEEDREGEGGELEGIEEWGREGWEEEWGKEEEEERWEKERIEKAQRLFLTYFREGKLGLKPLESFEAPCDSLL